MVFRFFKKQSSSFDFHGFASPARQAAYTLGTISDTQIDEALRAIAAALRENAASLLEANKRDTDNARKKSLAPAMIDRLTLDHARIESMAKSIEDIADLPHPAGKILHGWQRPNGLVIQKVSVPIGVLGMIYESRPNVTLDAAALCLKSRNAVILRGGSEAFFTNRALYNIITACLKRHGIPEAAVLFVPDTDRNIVDQMLRAHDLIDVLIPRGGKGLTGRVMREATMPVFAHLDGNCHVYIHESARVDIAANIVRNAKLRRTGICGAAESLLIDKNFTYPNDIIAMLLNEGCEIVGDAWAQSIDGRIKRASEEDWRTEYLEKKISIKQVDGFDDAIAHINHYGSHHTDCIITEDSEAAAHFMRKVDSAIVMCNASTQFADGGEFGFGAEIGIGTGKLHARGPVGLEQLCTFKYIVHGTGQTRP
jgi:glutamate-5-semialdehyde dehydrogenase